jgi:hypothetical protein
MSLPTNTVARMPDDAEAIAAVDDELMVVGSHGRRGRRCTRVPERERMVWLDRAGRVARTLDGPLRYRTAAECVAELFVADAPDRARAVCSAIMESECSAFEIEGAATVADGRTWVGLRSPTTAEGVIVLRIAPSNGQARFDDVAILAVAASGGVRALTAHDDALWALAGEEHTTLFRAPAADLGQGGPVNVEVVAFGLAGDAEGLVVSADEVVIVLDGASGDGECKAGARMQRVPTAALRRPSRGSR